MLVDDYDDERTLEEEEAYSGDSCTNELDDLEKEGEMPLEELLAIYREATDNQHDTRSSSEEEILSKKDLTLDKEEIARDLLQNSDDMDDKETSVNDLLDSVESTHTDRLLRVRSKGIPADGSSDEESEDVDYQPLEDDTKKVIQVGSDYQAVVPVGLSRYGDAPAYENEDRLLWDPSKLENNQVQTYLSEFHTHNMQQAGGVHAIPQGAHVRDDEQALYMLLQCGHNVEEAIRRRRMQAIPATDPMSLWSEEECRNFENGLRTYGKDFYEIQKNKVRTRSVGELVQFYYLWKKTERHDTFASKTRLEKRKYVLHPGVTDYMDRFLDDLSSPTAGRDRSTSPSFNTLMYADQKHHHHQLKPASVAADSSSYIPTVTQTGAFVAVTSSVVSSTHPVTCSPLIPSVGMTTATVSSSSDYSDHVNRAGGDNQMASHTSTSCYPSYSRYKADDDADDEDEGDEEPVVKKLKKDNINNLPLETNCDRSFSDLNHVPAVSAVHAIEDTVLNSKSPDTVHITHQHSESMAQS